MIRKSEKQLELNVLVSQFNRATIKMKGCMRRMDNIRGKISNGFGFDIAYDKGEPVKNSERIKSIIISVDSVEELEELNTLYDLSIEIKKKIIERINVIRSREIVRSL